MGAETMDKKAFFAIFQRFWDKVFNSRIIARNSFKKTGLIPLNPEVVLSKMKEYKQLQKQQKRRVRTPSPPTSLVRQSSPLFPSSPAFATPPPRTPSPTINWNEWDTPLTIRTRRKGVEYVHGRIEAALSGTPITPSVKRVQEKLEGAAERSILSGALAKQRVHDLSLAEQERESRNAPDNSRIVQKYGEIYVYQGRADIRADDEDLAKVVNMREARLSKPWRIKYAKLMKAFPKDYHIVKQRMRYLGLDLWE